ncbi:liver carboxylesterase 1 [Sitophilus oryzae]|uniref:Liver carboxylesterase 1 n=1 Tax=Sitophilus oryzae TaxID=7048 RepID=A0A6J2XJ38_SITOR|nr:liver carboxylesterase 1 [Sitophilus oryzae]
MFIPFFFLLIIKIVLCDVPVHHRVRRIVGGSPANYPPYDDPVVYIRFNGKAAKITGVRDFPHYVFKGIRYAEPPIKSDRFLRPKQKFLEGEVNATTFSPPCIQPLPGRNRVIGSEDCLSLNVFTPDLPSGTEGLPVIVWIHGGGFRYGSASQYGVRHLVGQRLVVVSIQYRLGSLGFLSTGSKHMPGNVALWDMALAVQWVRNYIGFFGGNPHKIVVMGHDTGASSALLVTLSKIAKGMPSAVIAMSGTAVSRWAVDNAPVNTAREIAEENGCPTQNDITMVRCLQQVPADLIIKKDSNIEFNKLQNDGFVSGMNGRTGARPVAEGTNDDRSLPGFIEYDPVESMYKRSNPHIPLLTGVTKDETKKAVNGHFKEDIVKRLSSIPNFLSKVLVSELQNMVVWNKLTGKDGLLGNISLGIVDKNGKLELGSLRNVLPNNFDNYLKVKSNDIKGQLDKIAEVTADALFNVPAFLTAQLWAGSQTFLYSFEHAGRMNKGSSFLKGLPLIGNSSTDDNNNIVGHGDELAYLFDAQDIDGNPLPYQTPTDDDVKVRNIFLRMINDFVRHGEITVNGEKAQSFNGVENNYIQIGPKPKLANKFRFCQMALWTNIGERLKSSSCQFLNAIGLTPDLPGLNLMYNKNNRGNNPTGGILGQQTKQGGLNIFG